MTTKADTPNRFEGNLVTILMGLGEEIKPWLLRPNENTENTAKLLVGAEPDLIRRHLEGAGYEITTLTDIPLIYDDWITVWQISK